MKKIDKNVFLTFPIYKSERLAEKKKKQQKISVTIKIVGIQHLHDFGRKEDIEITIETL